MSDIFRPAGISYLRIPAPEAEKTADFYRRVFGWTVDTERPDPSFEDGPGHVIGHFIPDGQVVGEAGIRPYVYVESVAQTLELVAAHGARSSRTRTRREI